MRTKTFIIIIIIIIIIIFNSYESTKNENKPHESLPISRNTSRDRRYAIFINVFKARAILNKHRDNKEHSNLIKR